MSASATFAAVCASTGCPDMTWTCAEPGTPACPMDSDAGDAASTGCVHMEKAEPQDVVGAQAPVEKVLCAEPLMVVAPLEFRSADVAIPAPDARGAPHLSVVIRI